MVKASNMSTHNLILNHQSINIDKNINAVVKQHFVIHMCKNGLQTLTMIGQSGPDFGTNSLSFWLRATHT